MSATDATIFAVGLTILLLSRKEAATTLGLSISTFARRESDGSIGPVPVRIGPGSKAAKRYRRDELERWCEAGCPDRLTWAEMEKASKRSLALTTVGFLR